MTRAARIAAAAIFGVGYLSATTCKDPYDLSTFGIVDARVEDDLSHPSGSSYLVSGTVRSSFAISVRHVDVGWIDLGAPVLTDVVVGDTADLPIHNPKSVPAGQYDAIRLRLTDLNVDLSPIGGSAVYEWSVFGDWQLEWTFADPVPLATDETVFFAVDLNVDQWTSWSSSTAEEVTQLLYEHVEHRVKGFN